MTIFKRIKINALLYLALSIPIQAADKSTTAHLTLFPLQISQNIILPFSPFLAQNTLQDKDSKETESTPILPMPSIFSPSFLLSTIGSVSSIPQAFDLIFHVASNYKGARIGLSLDFDDTLILSDERLARHYFRAEKSKQKSEVDLAVIAAAKNLSNSTISGINASLPSWLRQKKESKLLSSKIPTLMQAAMDQGITVFINTARPADEKSRHFTQQQLLSFTKLNHEGASQLPLKQIPRYILSYINMPYKFAYFDVQNILYTNGQYKGFVLDEYLRRANISFDVLFHIDDREDQASSMYKTFGLKCHMHSMVMKSERIMPFPTVASVNQYINTQFKKRVPSYPLEDFDWVKSPYSQKPENNQDAPAN